MSEVLYITPWATDKNLSGFYNRHIIALEKETDWICFTDRDTWWPDPFYGRNVESLLKEHGHKSSLFTCRSNRIGTQYQVVPKMWTVERGSAHEDRAKLLWQTHGTEIEDITDRSPLSGMMILVQKRLLVDNGQIEDGLLLGADNLLHYKARDAGEKIFMSMGLYIWHYYRSGVPTNMAHLR